MYKTFGQRILVLCLAAVLFLAAYGIARHYSPTLVTYVVSQTLIQKAPEGMSPMQVEKRFERLMAAIPSGAKLKKLLVLSNYLEKVQKLTAAELERLLANGE
jgi:hypothetical protein